MDRFTDFARAVNTFVASPYATFAAFISIFAWAVCGPAFHFSESWQMVVNTGTTIITFLMVFVLNNAQSRDTSAMNSKLDALIIALEKADNRLVGVEYKPDSDAKALSDEIHAAVQNAERHQAAHAAVDNAGTAKAY